MKSKSSLYLDTSVPSAYFDYSKPVRQLITEKWFQFEARKFKLFMSVLAVMEIENLKNDIKKEKIKSLIMKSEIEILEITPPAQQLSTLYIEKGAILKSEPEDALHIAIAAANKINSLASWNFKHIVSVNPIRKINEINSNLKYPYIIIGSPEIFGGAQYGNL